MNRRMKACIGTITVVLGGTAQGQQFTPVPLRSGSATNTASSIAGDGASVLATDVGDGFDTRVVRWQIGASMLNVIQPAAGFAFTRDAYASRNGSVVAGLMSPVPASGFTFRWTEAVGTQEVVGRFDRSLGISSDGSTIVGYNDDGNRTALRWTASGGIQTFGTLQGVPLPGPGRTNRIQTAEAASFDGSIITGTALVQMDTQLPIPTLRGQAWIWTAQTGARLLTNADGSTYLGGASASDISSDGAWIVGAAPGQFFRWRQSTGFEFFTPVALANIGDRVRVSDSGDVIVASTNYWSPQTGVTLLTTILTQAGCDFTGWTNISAVDVSGDGRTIAGNGTNPQGQQQGWVATVPGPGGVVVGGVVVCACAMRRRTNVRGV